MKTFHQSTLKAVITLALVFAGGVFSGQAQEENLNMALEMQDRRIAGLNKLADRVKNFNFFGLSSKVVTQLDERERKEDPFGMAMDPEDDLPEIQVEEELEEDDGVQAPGTTLQEALQKFNISGIFPGQQMIIVGAQQLGVNDKVAIEYSGVSFNLEITKVTQDEIQVRDTETGELASVSTGFGNAMPAGMSRRKPTASSEQEARQSSTIIPFSQEVIKVD